MAEREHECDDNPVTGKHMWAEDQCQLCLVVRPSTAVTPPTIVVIEELGD